MKKLVGLVLIGLIIGPTLFAASRFSLKASGGWGYFPQGDYNTGVQGLNDWTGDSFDNAAGRYGKLDKAWEGELELEIGINRTLGLGLAIGYRRMEAKSDISYDWNLLEFTFNTKEHASTVLASLPVALLLHARFPLGRGLRLAVNAGAEYAYHRLSYESHYESTVFLNSREDYTFQAQKTSFGFRAGLGLEATLSSRLSLVLEVEGRAAKLSGLAGSYERSGEAFGLPFSDNGDDHSLWYYEELYQGKTYPKILFGADVPQGADIGASRTAGIGLSGFAARAGLRFSF